MIKVIKKKILAMPVPARAVFIYTIASFVIKGFHIITTPLFTRIMTVEQIGIVSNFTTWESFFSTIATLGITSGAINIALKEYKDDRLGYIKTSQTIVTFGTLVVAFIVMTLFPFIRQYLGMPFHYIILIFSCILFSASRSLWMSWHRFEYRYIAVFLITVGSAILSTSIAVVAVIIARNRGIEDLATVRLYSASAVSLLFSVPIYIRFFLVKKAFLERNYALFALRVGLPMIVHTLSKSVLTASDRVMINAISGPESLGYYSVIYTLSSLALIVWDAVNASLIPIVFKKLDMGEKGDSSIKKITTPPLILFAVCSVLLVLFAPEMTKIIASEKYIEAIIVVPPVAAGIFFTALYNLYANLIMYEKKTKYIMYGTIGAALFNLVTNYVFIRQFGYVAAAYTTLSSYILLAILYTVISYRVTKRSIYNLKNIWTIASATVAFCLLGNVLYLHDIIRYAFIAGIIIMLIIYRKKILKMLNDLKTNNEDRKINDN